MNQEKTTNRLFLLGALGFLPIASFGQDVKFATQGIDYEVTFVTPQIVRVTKVPMNTNATDEPNLVVIKTPEKVNLKRSDSASKTTVDSEKLSVVVDRESGAVDFYDLNGRHLLKDKDYGTSFTPIWDGQKSNHTVRQSFLLDPEEPIFGIGQVGDGKWNRRGTSYHLQNENMFTYSPMFVSPTKSYGVYWDNYSISDFKDNPQDLSFEGIGNKSDYYFIYGDGDPKEVVAGIRELTGQTPMLPLWAYGFFQSRERYTSQDEVVEVFKKFRDLELPIDVIIQDWRYWPQINGTDSLWNGHCFDPERYPNPQKLGKDIHDMNGRLLIVTWPGFGASSEPYRKMEAKNHIIDFYTFPEGSGAKPYDAYSEEARDMFWESLDQGVYSVVNNDGWWLDSTEPDHIYRKDRDYEVPTAAGAYKAVKNAFSLMQNKGIYENQRRKSDRKRVLTLTRSGFVGQQHYGATTWSGDVESRWDVLRDQIPAALNYASMGIPYWNSDIGGFWGGRWHDDGGFSSPEWQELYVRWMQFGTFCSMMRSHGTGIPREIFLWGDRGTPAFDAQEKMLKLRYRMLPYNYATAWDVTSNAGSFIRPLYLDFVDDVKAVNTGDQYMYGQSFLVAPVTEYQARQREVYLPAGTDWWNFWDNSRHSGGQSAATPAAFDEIPLYVKAGSIVPWGPEVKYTGEKNWKNLEIRIYPGADGEFTLYEDAGDSYDYEQGMFSTIEMKWDDASQTLTLSDRKGSYPGMQKNRKFNIVLMKEGNPSGDQEQPHSTTISYSGKSKQITL